MKRRTKDLSAGSSGPDDRQGDPTGTRREDLPRAGRDDPSRFRPARALPKAARLCLGAFLAASLAAAGGCGGVSEDEMEKLRAENAALAAELESERRESELLNRALAAVYVERDRLVELLEAPPPPPEPDEGSEPEPAPVPRIHVVQRGDTLSQIASRYRTTTSALVALNPFLRDRQDLMVMENDKIALPD